MATSSRQKQRGRRAQKRRQAQQRIIIGALVFGAVMLGAIILINAGSQSADPAMVTQAIARYEGLSQSVSDDVAAGYALGDQDAPITIVEYSDFSCPHCADLSEIMHLIVEEYVRAGDVQVIYKPVAFINPQYSVPAAEAAICAGEQGAFWEMQDMLWSIHMTNSPAAYVPRVLTPLSDALELDTARYNSCRQSSDATDILAATENELRALSQQAGLNSVGTPTIFLNGTMIGYTGADTYYQRLSAEIENALGN